MTSIVEVLLLTSTPLVFAIYTYQHEKMKDTKILLLKKDAGSDWCTKLMNPLPSFHKGFGSSYMYPSLHILYAIFKRGREDKTCMSSMIHSTKLTVSPVVNIVFAWKLFCITRLWNVGTDRQHVRKQLSLPVVTVVRPSGSIGVNISGQAAYIFLPLMYSWTGDNKNGINLVIFMDKGKLQR